MSHITHSSKQEARARHVRKDLDPSRGAVFGKVVSGEMLLDYAHMQRLAIDRHGP